MNENENWIDEVLNSGRSVGRTEPPASLLSKIESAVKTPARLTQVVSLRWVYSTAAALLLVLVINVTVWRNSSKTSRETKIQQFMQAYDLSTDDYSINYSN